tara:strand:- start:593 stop:1669 length:1077 start_codon:yes stop_codon:yes gene_type:complete
MLFNKKNFTFVLYIFFFILVLFLIDFSTNQVYAKNYKIKNIEIVEPYDLDFNKLQVIDKAFIKAFQELILKITSENDGKKLKNIKLNTIKSLVDSFSIVDEKFIDNNYLVNFEVDFNKKSLLKYLERKNIFPSIPIEKKIFILPILIDLESDQISLFSENQFYINWNKENENYFLLNYILPNEDLEDINFLQQRIKRIENYNFNEIISKYSLEDYIIVILFKDKKNIRVLSKVYLNKNLSILNRDFHNINLNNNSLTNKIIRELKFSYENQWKKQNLINTSINLSITLSLDSKNIDLIGKFEKHLSELDLVSKYYIDKFSSDNTVYKIIYNSTPDKFLSEFRNLGFEVDTSYKIWKVR